jgi:hypothetical protein
MPRRLLLACVFVFLAACQPQAKVATPAPAAPADPRLLTAAEQKVITDEILRNWDLEVMKGCPWGEMAPLRLEIALGEGGAVTGVTALEAVAQDECTQTAYRSAEEAVRNSSPLAIPPGKSFPYLRLRLKPLHAVW